MEGCSRGRGPTSERRKDWCWHCRLRSRWRPPECPCLATGSPEGPGVPLHCPVGIPEGPGSSHLHCSLWAGPSEKSPPAHALSGMSTCRGRSHLSRCLSQPKADLPRQWQYFMIIWAVQFHTYIIYTYHIYKVSQKMYTHFEQVIPIFLFRFNPLKWIIIHFWDNLNVYFTYIILFCVQHQF